MTTNSFRFLLGVAALSAVLLPERLSAQFANSGTTLVSVTVSPEAAIRIDSATTTLTATGTVFNNFIGTTNFTYKIRTTTTTGAANIQASVTSDFSPSNGPSVASPLTAGDTLTYVCSVSSPATSCSGSQTASTTSGTSIASFGAGANSATTGNSGSTTWTLVNDPKFHTGTYSATVTLTVSAT